MIGPPPRPHPDHDLFEAELRRAFGPDARLGAHEKRGRHETDRVLAGIIETERKLTPEEARALKAEWLERYNRARRPRSALERVFTPGDRL